MDRRGGAGAGAGVTTPRENLSAGVNSRLKLEACTVAGRQSMHVYGWRPIKFPCASTYTLLDDIPYVRVT